MLTIHIKQCISFPIGSEDDNFPCRAHQPDKATTGGIANTAGIMAVPIKIVLRGNNWIACIVHSQEMISKRRSSAYTAYITACVNNDYVYLHSTFDYCERVYLRIFCLRWNCIFVYDSTVCLDWVYMRDLLSVARAVIDWRSISIQCLAYMAQYGSVWVYDSTIAQLPFCFNIEIYIYQIIYF